MKGNNKFVHQFVARLLLVSLCLQSCNNYSNQPIPIQEETDNKQVAIKQLVDKQLISKEGHAVTFYKEGNQLQAIVKEEYGSLSKTYDMPVYIATDINTAQVANLNEEKQNRLIQVNLPKNKQAGFVYLGKAGLMGGSSKGKEKMTEEEEEAESTESYYSYYNRHPRLLTDAIEGKAEAQFILGQRAYELWKKDGQKKDKYRRALEWLLKAANQGHQAAIALLKKGLHQSKNQQKKGDKGKDIIGEREWKRIEQNLESIELLWGRANKVFSEAQIIELLRGTAEEGNAAQIIELLRGRTDEGILRAELIELLCQRDDERTLQDVRDRMDEDEGISPEQANEFFCERRKQLLELLCQREAEGDVELQYTLGKRAYELWKSGGQKQKEEAYREALDWLGKAAKQEHARALTLLNELRLPIGEKQEDEIEVERIESFIAEAVKNAENAQGKDIFLILGKTGAGKSAITNYLLGSKMQLKEDKDLGGHYAITEDPNKSWAKIGHGTNAETYFPNTYSSPDSEPIHYCDCPGFLENRSEQTQLNTTIATQIMINSAKSIEGIIIVIALHDLVDGRAEGIKEVGLILSHFLNANIDPKSILFVFNNKNSPKRTLTQIHNHIKRLIGVEKEKLNNPAIRGEEREKIDMLLVTLNRISNNKDNTFLIDILDDFESKRQIENKLGDLKPAPKESFNFSQYDETRVKFNVLLTKIVGGLSNKLNQYIEATNDIVTYQGRMESSKERVNTYNNHLDWLNQGKKIHDQEYVRDLEQDVQKYIQKLTSLQEKQVAIKHKMGALIQEGLTLNTEEEIIYEIKQFKEKRAWLIGSLSWSDKAYKYEGIPFSKVITSNRKGRFKDPIEQPNEGKYTVTYSTSIGEDEDAEVRIYIKRKDHPDNKNRIEQINQELAIQGKRMEEYDEEINTLNRSQEVTQRLVEYHNSNVQKQERDLENRKKELKQEIARIAREEGDLIQKVEQQEKLKEETEIYLASRKNIIDSISTVISHGIGSESALVEHFKELCKIYRNIMEKNPNYSSSLANEDLPECLECPIGGNVFEDPVIIKCGHTFNRKSLLDWFAKQPSLEKKCPDYSCTILTDENDLRPNLIVHQIKQHFEEKRLEKIRNTARVTYLSPEEFKNLSSAEQHSRFRIMERKRGELQARINNAKKEMHDIDVLKKLYKKTSLSVQPEQSDYALHDAVAKGNLSKVRELLDQGAEVDSINDQGRTPLHIAAELGNMAITQLLIEHDANVNTINSEDYTPIEVAMSYDHVQLATLLSHYSRH